MGESEELDLAAAVNGAMSLVCNDMFFSHMGNLIMPGRGINMGDGWETARRRGPGNDWVILKLGHCGTIDRIEVDTAHFKGNYPERVSIEAAQFGASADVEAASHKWQTLLPEMPLAMDKQHFFQSELRLKNKITHVRMSIFPDGGISRLRLFGRVCKP